MDMIKVLNSEIVKRIAFFTILIVLLYFIRSLLDMLLLTFLFSYLINSLQNFIIKRLTHVIRVKKVFVSIILYSVIIFIVSVFLYKYVPIIVNESISFAEQIPDINISTDSPILANYLLPILNKIDLNNFTNTGIDYLVKLATNIGEWSMNVFLALLLSALFIFEKDKIIEFTNKLKDSKASFFYKYFRHYGVNFLNTFGKVIQAQVIIAFVNTVLSVIMLSIMGFPKLMALGFLILFLSLIPVAGVLISLIPLSIIAFKIGGLMKVLYVLIMIAVIHALESYILNPRLMASKTSIPVFFIFVILIVSEKLFGIWGLLLGIPLFMFTMDILEVKI